SNHLILLHSFPTRRSSDLFEICDTFYSHTKSKTCEFFTIYFTVFQYIRIHHATAQYFHPTGVFTELTTLSFANGTRDIHFRRRFGKWEVRRSKTYFSIFAEQLLTKIK